VDLGNEEKARLTLIIDYLASFTGGKNSHKNGQKYTEFNQALKGA
jgi:replicative DNA helicase